MLLRNISRGNYPIQYDDNNNNNNNNNRRRDEKIIKYKFPPLPNPLGKELIEKGIFGINNIITNNIKINKHLQYLIMSRELGISSTFINENKINKIIQQTLIPNNKKSDFTINYKYRGYNGQFSDDGNFFFTCGKDMQVRMYDTSNPYEWKYYKKVSFYGGQWTITDSSLSRDNKFLIYSSMHSKICLTNTDPDNKNEPEILDLKNYNRNEWFSVSSSFLYYNYFL